MSSTRIRSALSVLLGGLAVFASAPVRAAYSDLNMTQGVTPLSRDVYDLHMIILWICVAIGVVVFGAMFYSILKHRKSTGYKAAQFHHSTFAEVVWTIIPFVILIVMAIPATKTLIAMEDTSDADMTVKITGYQWKWKYEYLEDDIAFYSNLAPSSRAAIYTDPTSVENYLLEVDNPVVLPVGKKVRLLLTADDVIHAWWIPELGMKRDALPGFINQMWTLIEEPGVYRGQCAELCGKDHGFMPIVVIAKSDEDYKAWVAEQKAARVSQAAAAARDWSRDELMAQGETVYSSNCAACHQPDGSGLPNMFPPIAGSEVAKGPLEQHLKLVLHGRPGTPMQAFSEQLTDVQLAAVVTYQRNAFGNDAGDLLQPADVNAARR